jgi:hypothetical protein
VPSENKVALWNLENDIMLHKVEKEKLPKLNKNWSEYYLSRFEERLHPKFKNKNLNFYIPYEKLSESEKQHYIPDQKVSMRMMIIDNDERCINNDNISNIYNNIMQVVNLEIQKYIESLQDESSINDSSDDSPETPAITKSISFAQVTVNPKIQIISHESNDDLALLHMKTDENNKIFHKVSSFDDLQLIKRPKNVDTDKKNKLKKLSSMVIENNSNLAMKKRASLDHPKISKNLLELKDNLLKPIPELSLIREKSESIDHLDHIFEKIDRKASKNTEKAQDLTKLYEFDLAEDPDPYYEINNCHVMTHLETIASKTMNQYIRVDKTPPAVNNERKDSDYGDGKAI